MSAPRLDGTIEAHHATRGDAADEKSASVRLLIRALGSRFALGASSLLAPDFARLWAEQLFLSPPRAHLPADQPREFRGGRARWLMHRGRRIATWSWGLYNRPAVLLVHGWGGNAGQMSLLVSPLLAEGLRVIAFDQPAHGLSEGTLTGLPDLAEAVAEVARQHGGVRAVAAHSIGSAATALALARGMPAESVVLLSAPSDMVEYSRRFARWHWIPESVRGAMQAAIEERFGVRWAELDVIRVAPHLTARALFIHDRRDRIVPWTQGRAFAEHWPGARLLLTDGLGHARILRDQTIVRAIADFVVGRSEVANLALPPIPRPAPIY
jgi:pimeloyl-ACP methyl ester carboxylesterase